MNATAPSIRRETFRLRPALWSWIAVGLVLLGLLWIAYARTFKVLGHHFVEPEYSHGFLIPLITVFFLWNRRHALLAERSNGSWWGVALALVALAILVAGVLASIFRLPTISLILLLLGIGYAALGARASRRIVVPILFLATAIPLPGLLYVMFSTQLQLISSMLGGWMLQMMGVPVFVGGNIIDLGVYKLQVAEACSGLRYLFPLIAFGFLCAWLMRAPLWMRALVLASSVPLTVVLNSARIAVTGLIVQTGNIHLAEGFMHLFEGWVVFLIALAILFGEMWLLCRLYGGPLGPLDVLDFDRINGAPPVPATSAPSHPPVPLLMIVGLLAATLIGLNDWRDREQLTPARPGLASFPTNLGAWEAGVPRLLDPVTERVLKASDYLLVDYERPGGAPVNVWVAYYANQVQEAAIHSPKECLPGAGWEYVEFGKIDAPVDPTVSPGFELNRAVIANGHEQMVMYYWLDMRGKQFTNDTLTKVYNLYDSIRLQRSDGALVRLLTPVRAGEAASQAEARLADFLARAYPHLQPHVGL